MPFFGPLQIRVSSWLVQLKGISLIFCTSSSVNKEFKREIFHHFDWASTSELTVASESKRIGGEIIL
jgi:hypothetical protein